MQDKRNQDLKKLSDKKDNGKERPWRERKKQSVNMSKVLEWGDEYEFIKEGYAQTFEEARADKDKYVELIGWLGRKSGKMLNCGDTLEFLITPDEKKKLYRAYFCKDRLCPMCNWRRSIKIACQIQKILQEMQAQKIEGKPIFLTLTMENVKGSDIGDSFSHFAKSFKRLYEYKAVENHCIGAIRASEITYNKERNDYNTHIHCLLWMKNSYYAGKNYLSQAKWTELWKRAAKLDYTPIVNVKSVKRNPTETDPVGYINAVFEISKYFVKPTNIPGMDGLTWGDEEEGKREAGEVISALERGMEKKRLISFFGIIKDLHKELNLDDTEDGDLVGADTDKTTDELTTVEHYRYDYSKHEYYCTATGKRVKHPDAGKDKKLANPKYDFVDYEGVGPVKQRDNSDPWLEKMLETIKEKDKKENDDNAEYQKRVEKMKNFEAPKNGTEFDFSEKAVEEASLRQAECAKRLKEFEKTQKGGA